MELCPHRPRCCVEQPQRGKMGKGARNPHSWQVPTPTGKPATNGVRHVPLLNHFVIFCHCDDSSCRPKPY